MRGRIPRYGTGFTTQNGVMRYFSYLETALEQESPKCAVFSNDAVDLMATFLQLHPLD